MMMRDYAKYFAELETWKSQVNRVYEIFSYITLGFLILLCLEVILIK